MPPPVKVRLWPGPVIALLIEVVLVTFKIGLLVKLTVLGVVSPLGSNAMLTVPEKSEFPVGKAASQGEWLNVVKTNGCIACHALGTRSTRTVPRSLGDFKSSEEAWARRITSGQAMMQMVNALARNDTQRMLKQFANWTDRVAHALLDDQG